MPNDAIAIFKPAQSTVSHRIRERLLARRVQAAKLLGSKWTAAVPVDKEKHFVVTALIAPDAPGTLIDAITMEAVLTGRSFTLRWRELNDAARWLQGWR